MGGIPGMGDNSALGTGMAKIAQQYPQLGGLLGSLGYQGQQGPQLPLGVTDPTAAPDPAAAARSQSGFNDIAQFGQNMMAPKMGTPPQLKLPPAFQPQVVMPNAPLTGGAPPSAATPTMAPTFFPIFRR